MTAEQIRKAQERNAARMIQDFNRADYEVTPTESLLAMQAGWFAEIAAQLAELNQRLSGMEIERVTLIRTGSTDATYGSETKQTVERIGERSNAQG